MSSKTFLMVANGPYGNKGCEGIVRGTVEILSSRFPESHFLLSSFGKTVLDDAHSEIDSRIEHRPHAPQEKRFSPSWIKNRILYPTSQAKRDYRVQWSALQESECTLQIGGDNYSLDYGIPMHLVHMDKLLMSTGKPLVIWGGSVGPFRADADVESTFAKHLQTIDLILARETETVAYLSSIGVEENVKLVADPAFALQPKQPNLPSDLVDFIERRPLGLNFSPELHRGDGSPRLVRECLEKLIEAKIGPILLVPHVVQCISPDDYGHMFEAGKTLPGWGDQIAILPRTLAAAEYKWVISRLKVFAGARMHSTIAAISSGVPTILLAYSMKANGVAQDVYGNRDWVVPFKEVTPENLLKQIKALLSAEDDLRSHLKTRITELSVMAYSASDHIVELLKQKEI